MTSEVACGQAIFEYKCVFFPVARAQNVDKKQQSVYLRHILHVQRKNLNFQLMLIISILSKIMAAILDGTAPSHPPAAPQPIIFPSCCSAHHWLSTEGKLFLKYRNPRDSPSSPAHVPWWG